MTPIVCGRRLIAGGAGAVAAAGLGALGRITRKPPICVDLPFANGGRNWLRIPEAAADRADSRPPQLETPFEVFNEA